MPGWVAWGVSPVASWNRARSMLLAEAEKDRAVLQVFVGDLQPQGLV